MIIYTVSTIFTTHLHEKFSVNFTCKLNLIVDQGILIYSLIHIKK